MSDNAQTVLLNDVLRGMFESMRDAAEIQMLGVLSRRPTVVQQAGDCPSCGEPYDRRDGGFDCVCQRNGAMSDFRAFPCTGTECSLAHPHFRMRSFGELTLPITIAGRYEYVARLLAPPVFDDDGEPTGEVGEPLISVELALKLLAPVDQP